MNGSAFESAVPSADRSQQSPYVEVERLGKRLGARDVLRDVSLRVASREFAAVLGPSGAGKTTLLRCVAGLLEAESGSVRLGGTDVRALKGGERRRVAVVFQQFNLVSRISALAQQPELIVADEPVASLDPANGLGILELLKGICRDEGVSVLCSLHQIHYARQFADHVIGMSEGRVLFDVEATAFDEQRARALYGQFR